MAPKRNLATSDGEEEERRHRHKGHKRHRPNRRQKEKEKLKMKLKKKKQEEKEKEWRMKLDEKEANKSLYICSLEHHVGQSVSYVVRAIRLSDLLSSSSSFKHPLRLQQLAYKSGSDLTGSVGCAVWGSQIVLVGGSKPNVLHGLSPLGSKSIFWNKGVYCFETQQEDEEDMENRIRKKDASFTLLQPKVQPFIVEMCGRLYALSKHVVGDPPVVFEVFDPKVGRWAALPTPPFLTPNSPHYRSNIFTYVVAGTKMFVSNDEGPVFCFDVAHPRRQWRLVSTMCRGGPFPFRGKAFLVLNLPDDSKKIMFTFCRDHWRLRVYLMSLVENMESISLIDIVNLPDFPVELGHPNSSDIVHIGGWKACVVITHLTLADDEQRPYETGTHKRWGVVIPFQFEVDMSKVDKGREDCFTSQVMPLCVFKYRTNPSTYPRPETVGCFVL